MTADPHPIATPPVVYQPPWVPQEMHELVPVGHEFDVVRIRGLLGDIIVDALTTATGDAGPVIRHSTENLTRPDPLYFVVPPGTVADYEWPPGIRAFDRTTPTVLGVPALWGNTRPLSWRSRPTQTARFVDPGRLYRVLCRVTTWPASAPRPFDSPPA